MLLKVCLNGPRGADEHPSVPLTPAELAEEARRSVDAGSEAVHLHLRDESGTEMLAGLQISPRAHERAAAFGVGLDPGPGAYPYRCAASLAHRPDSHPDLDVGERPDFASVNLFEEGWRAVFETLDGAGIGVKAGLWSSDDARRLVEAGLAERCLRLLLEPVRETSAEAALAAAREMNRFLEAAGVETSRLLHGKDATAWPLLRHAAAEGLGMRIGFEDTLTLPDGELAQDNARLVTVAREISSTAPGGPAPR